MIQSHFLLRHRRPFPEQQILHTLQPKYHFRTPACLPDDELAVSSPYSLV
jgi:hypothetical protein